MDPFLQAQNRYKTHGGLPWGRGLGACVFAVGRRSARHSSLQAARLQARNSTNLPGRPFRPGRREKGGQPRT